MDVLPKVRMDIDAFPYEDADDANMSSDGETFILYDKSGLSEAQLMVSELVMYFIVRMEGKKSVSELREEFEEDGGEDTSIADIEEIVKELDKARFLDNHNYQDLYNNLYNKFIMNPLRESASSGSVYSDDKEVLRSEIAGLIESAPKPEVEGRVGNVMRRAPRGVVAPHMDFTRAGTCYGQVYRELLQYNAPEVVIILGTAHGKLKNRFSVCDKDFELTSGVAECHKEVTARILHETSYIADFKEDIFAHRSEHSIELQAVWVKYIWPDAKIVPILVGEMDEFIKEPGRVKGDRQIVGMLEAISGVMSEYRTTVIASADLSHVGRRFGDDRDLDISFISETEVADRSYLKRVALGSAGGALESLAGHNDQYHICGTGCIYMLNALLPDVEGQLLGYYQAVSQELEQAVGCAGVIFE